MENKAKNKPLSVILLAVCSFVGAGFISGAEIWFYFAKFGWGMVFGLIIFAVLMYLLAFFCQIPKKTFPSRFCTLRENISFISEFLVASAMISGIREVSVSLFGKFWLIAFILSIIIISLLLFSEKKKFLFYNFFVAIFIIFVIVSLFLFDNNNSAIFIEKFSLKNLIYSIVFACVYAFMNIAEIKSILSENAENFSVKQKKIIAFSTSLVLIFLIFALSILVLKNSQFASDSMPLLEVFKTQKKIFVFIFSSGLVMCMVSTAEACLIAVKNKLNFKINASNFTNILVIIISLILSQISFSFFVKIIYPFIAILNFLVFVLEFYFYKKSSK